MSTKPIKKYFGELNADKFGKAFKSLTSKVETYQDERYFKVEAAQWANGELSIYVWDGDKKEEIKLGRLKVSKFYNSNNDNNDGWL